MSAAAMGWALQTPTGSPTRKLVLLALADRHNGDTGRCDPSMKRLVADTELSESTVRKVLGELAATGFVEVVRRVREDGTSRSNSYVLRMEGTPRQSAPPPSTAEGSPPDSRPRTRSRTRKEPVATSTDVATVAEHAPPLLMVNGRNLAFDALRTECGIQESSPRLVEVATALNGVPARRIDGIRDLAWREASAHIVWPEAGTVASTPQTEAAIARLIHERAAMYRNVMGDAHLTPLALRKWWVDLPGMQSRANGGALDAAAAAADELRRMQ